jgi:hypothetical protein
MNSRPYGTSKTPDGFSDAEWKAAVLAAKTHEPVAAEVGWHYIVAVMLVESSRKDVQLAAMREALEQIVNTHPAAAWSIAANALGRKAAGEAKELTDV